MRYCFCHFLSKFRRIQTVEDIAEAFVPGSKYFVENNNSENLDYSYNFYIKGPPEAIYGNWQPFKTDKQFLLPLKSSFPSYDLKIFILTFLDL